MDIGFIAVETFIPTQKYVNWSRLFQLEEIISIDCALCPRIAEYSEEEYNYYQWLGDYWVYNNLDFLLKKVVEKAHKQVLTVIREPEIDCKSFYIDERFKFYGYDLIEDSTCISALTNCGGFDKAFVPSDISSTGLIEEFVKAKEVQLKLREKYPYEEHADCSLWAIWRMI